MRLARGAQRLLGELPQEPESLFNKAIAGRSVGAEPFDVDVTNASKLWLVVQENGSSAPERIEAVWANAELLGPTGSTRVASLTPVEISGARRGSRPIVLSGSKAAVTDGVRVSSPSLVVYDIAGKGFSRFRGTVGIENPDVGSTLQPQIRFFVFNQAPNLDRLVPPVVVGPLPSVPKLTSASADHRSRLPLRPWTTALRRRARRRASRAGRSGEARGALAVCRCGSVVGRPDEAGISADLLRMS